MKKAFLAALAACVLVSGASAQSWVYDGGTVRLLVPDVNLKTHGENQRMLPWTATRTQ